MKNSISIVIGVRDRKKQLVNCLDSLALQTDEDFEIIIVDYGGTETIKDLVQDLGCKYIYTHNTGIYSRTHALNIGIQAASNEFILCSDADMIFAPNFIGTASEMASKDAIVLCHCKKISPRLITNIWKFKELLKNSKPGHEFSIGGCQMLHKDVWQELGGFDEDLVGWGSEDWDIMHRVKRKGLKKIFMHNRTSMIHQDHDSCIRTAYRNDILWALHDKMVKERVMEITRNKNRGWGKVRIKPRRRILNIMVSANIGGVERKALNVFKGLDKLNYEIYTIITDSGGPLLDELQEVSDFFLNLSPMNLKKKTSILKDLIRDVHFDILHIWNSPLGDNIAQSFDRRIVIGLYGNYKTEGPFYNTRKKNIEELKGKNLILITDNQSNKEEFPNNKMVHVHTGIDSPHNIELPIERFENRCIWVGRTTPDKNLILYIKLAKAMPDMDFLLLIPELPNDPLYLADNISIKIGVTDREELYKLYRSANFYLNTSTTEGTPQAALEAMKSDCIPICSDIGGLHYLLEDVGTLIPVEDIKKKDPEPLMKAIEDYRSMEDVDLDSLRGQIFEKTGPYNIPNMVKEIEAVYDLDGKPYVDYPEKSKMQISEEKEPMRMLIIVDVYDWAWDIASKELLAVISDDIKGEIFSLKHFLEKEIDPDEYDVVITYTVLAKVVMDKLDPGRTVACVAGGDVERYEKLFKDSCKRFHHFGACNSTIQKSLQDRYPDKNIFVLSHGVDTDLFQPRAPKHKKFTIGWAGRTKRALKRFNIAKQIAKELEVELKVADFYGDGNYEFYDHKSMPDFYNSIDVLLMTSETEAHPMVAYEALSCGIPIISTRVGDLPENITDGKNGFLVPIDAPKEEYMKHIRKLMEDEALRAKMGINARMHILKNWTWDKVKVAYEELPGILYDI